MAARAESSGTLAALTTGVILPPLVWLVAFAVRYVLVEAACDLGWRWAHVATTVTALVAVGVVAALVWRSWLAVGRGWPSAGGGAVPRTNFLAVVGLLTSGLFLLAVVAQELPALVMNPCQ